MITDVWKEESVGYSEKQPTMAVSGGTPADDLRLLTSRALAALCYIYMWLLLLLRLCYRVSEILGRKERPFPRVQKSCLLHMYGSEAPHLKSVLKVPFKYTWWLPISLLLNGVCTPFCCSSHM